MYQKALQKGIQLFHKYCRQSVLTRLQKQRVLCHGDSMQRPENSQMRPEHGTTDINTCATADWSNSAWIYFSYGSTKRTHVHCVHSFASFWIVRELTCCKIIVACGVTSFGLVDWHWCLGGASSLCLQSWRWGVANPFKLHAIKSQKTVILTLAAVELRYHILCSNYSAIYLI